MTDAAGDDAAAEMGEALAEPSHQGPLDRREPPGLLPDLVRLGGVRMTSADLCKSSGVSASFVCLEASRDQSGCVGLAIF